MLKPGVPPRRHDLDALRVFATAAVFLFHCAKFFDPDGWHLTDAHPSEAAGAAVYATSLWLMPLFFVISGMSTEMALGSRPALRFLGERTLRLVVPLVFGILVVVPPQVWVERVGQERFDGSYLAFYPHYFDGFYAFGGNFAWMGLHLWYLQLLFLLTLVLLPLLLWLRAGSGQRALAAVRRTLGGRAGLLLLVAVPTFLVEWAIARGPLDVRDLGGWSPVQYVVFFLAGVLIADPQMRPAFRAIAYPCFGLAIVATVTLLWASSVPDGGPLDAVPIAVWRALRSLASWGALLGFLGFGVRFLDAPSRTLGHLAEASMPFYVLHQTVILLVGFAIVGWAPGTGLKYVALAAASFAITALGTEMVRRVPPLRFLFGLKWRPRQRWEPRGRRRVRDGSAKVVSSTT